MSMPLEKFQQQITASGLMSAEELASCINQLPSDRRPQDSRQLARELVRRKKLTAFQAQQLYAGKGRSLLLGNYVILDKLGQGGMGVVLKAQHRRMERMVALKVISPKAVRSPDALARFHREVKAAARLEHPNIVIAHDADETAGTHFLVMQYVDGSDLSAVVRQRGPLAVGQAVDCILQAARGLQYAHEHGVVHRDIKPANLLLDGQGTVKVLDMGLARLDSAGVQQDELTGTGQIMGTMDYMAPEQAMNTKNADARADIYSLGVTLWYLLTGRALYKGENPVEKIMAHQTQPIPSLREACPAVSPALDALFGRMVAKTPEARYQSMAELIADLESLGDQEAKRSRAPAVREDSKLESFLEGLGPSATLARRSRISSQPAPASTVGTQLAPGPIADQDITQACSGPDVATDPQTEQSLPRGRTPASGPKKSARPPKPPWWQDGKALAAAGAAAFLLLLLGVWVIIRDKDGRIVGKFQVPEGGSATIKPITTLPAPVSERPEHRSVPAASEPQPVPPWDLPADAPAPAIAPFDSDQARAHQEAWAEYLGQPVEMTQSIGDGVELKMTLIPPGEFMMGSPESEEDRRDNEGPQHRVRITRPFYLGVYPVTQSQWVSVMGNNPSSFSDGGIRSDRVSGLSTDDFPVEMVSWYDAQEFVGRLNERSEETGLVYRLPTEAEWEYACRSGTTTRYFSGDDVRDLGEYAWFRENSGSRPHPVGQKRPNAWGLYDMHGNVWEWCSDWSRSYTNSPLEDPTGPESGSDRVDRGGCWLSTARGCRSADRRRNGPRTRSGDLGFRVAFSSVDEQSAEDQPTANDEPRKKIAELESRLAALSPDAFDWGLHNALRHLYSLIDRDKSMSHIEIILQNQPYCGYMKFCLGGHNDDKRQTVSALLTVATEDAHLPHLSATCWIWASELESDRAKAREYVDRAFAVEGISERWRQATDERLQQAEDSSDAVQSDPNQRATEPTNDQR